MKRSYISLFCILITFSTASTHSTQKDPVAIIGCGYVGLTLAGVLSQQDQKIVCVDIDTKRIADLQNKKLPIYEPYLQELLFDHNDNLFFTAHLEDARNARLYYLCVATPTNERGETVRTFLYEAFDAVLKQCSDNSIIVVKSTIAPGTMKILRARIPEEKKNKIRLVYNPEFMREGSALHDIYNSNPIVLGADSYANAMEVQNMYHEILQNAAIKTIITDFETAELIKYSWNAFSALRITYINELAFLCTLCQANIKTLIQGVALSEELLPTHKLVPGPGFGGSCLPKDTASFAHILEKYGVKESLIHQTIASDINHKKRIIANILQHQPSVVTLLGLSFKANTNDIRNAIAIDIINELLKHGITIKAYDPHAIANMKSLFPKVEYYDSPYDATSNTDLVVVLTEWQEIKALDVMKLADLCSKKVMIDTRSLFDAEAMRMCGFDYKTW